jgi:large subunit ribosomal protein L17
MRHRVDYRKLGRTTSHRKAMLQNIVTSLMEHERIITTLAKAKEARRLAEKLITKAKKDTLHARRQIIKYISRKDVVTKMCDTLSARFADRNGGYTRIIKIGPRKGDSAELAVLELIGSDWLKKKEEREKAKKAKEKEKKGLVKGGK